MGMIFLILFAAAEIALVILTVTRYGEKAQWLKNRMLVRGLEAVLILGMILLPTTHMKWRFLAATAIVVIRLIIAAISWLTKHKKAVGIKKKGGMIVNCILSIMVMLAALVSAFIFTNYDGIEPTGECGVMENSAILVDESREDTFEKDGSFREVPVHFYYPDGEGKFPLIVFSHGAFGYYQSNYSTYTELASHGYVVVALDHPHHAFFSTDTEGNTVIVNDQFLSEALAATNGELSIEEEFETTKQWMELRTADENFVLDTIKEAEKSSKLSDVWHTEDEKGILSILSKTDTEQIGLMGHSMGGATAVALGRERTDIDAVIDLDGTMLSEIVGIKDGAYQYNKQPYPTPVLDFGKKSDYDEFSKLEEEQNYVYANQYVIDNAKDGRLVLFKDAGHMNFTDLPLISPFLASMLETGTVDSEEFMTTVNGVVLEWFDHYLKGENEPDIQEMY